jgi:hypothetical protein
LSSSKPAKKEFLVDGMLIPVIGREDFLRNKHATGRLKDLADAERLEKGESSVASRCRLEPCATSGWKCSEPRLRARLPAREPAVIRAHRRHRIARGAGCPSRAARQMSVPRPGTYGGVVESIEA